jgi:outer membrane protein OmpA-like peptidoglycan-associated protein
VKTSADALNSRIDTTNGELKETRDQVDRVNTRVTQVDGRVTTVDGRVTELDTKTTQGMNTLRGEFKTDVSAVNTKVDRTDGNVSNLDQRFQKRNNFTVSTEKSVLFKFDSARLDPAYTADLDAIASTLTSNPDAFVVLEGHTDATGDETYNVRLGERRVEAVKNYLAVEKMVPVYKIHVISFGAARPIAENNSRENREKNRAVSISVMVPPADSRAANQ